VRKTYRYDPDAKELIPLDEWFAKYGDPSEKAHHLIGEFKPYRPVTGDMEGKWITTRRQHREFLKRNNLVEVGNEKAYMTRHGGMTADNPNLMSDAKREEQICRSLVKNLERLKSR
jgi:hypothetical protein